MSVPTEIQIRVAHHTCESRYKVIEARCGAPTSANDCGMQAVARGAPLSWLLGLVERVGQFSTDGSIFCGNLGISTHMPGINILCSCYNSLCEGDNAALRIPG